jgi:hypothetical protein
VRVCGQGAGCVCVVYGGLQCGCGALDMFTISFGCDGDAGCKSGEIDVNCMKDRQSATKFVT